jgi:hypothetical protein
MRRVSRLINEFYLPIAISISFTLLVALTPFLYYQLSPNSYLQMMSLRCLTLDLLCGALFFVVKDGSFRRLTPFALVGALFSLLYLVLGSFWILVPCLSLTITSVIMTALVAFSLIEVTYGS